MPIFFNGDCNFLFSSTRYQKDPARFAADDLRAYVDQLADGGVDTFIINASGQVPWYPSKRLESVLDGHKRGDPGRVMGYFPPLSDDFTAEQRDAAAARQVAMLDRLLDLADAGVDWMAELSAACRKRGMSPWVSVRMNDAHGSNNWEEGYFNCPPQRDPACRLRGTQPDPKQGIDPAANVCDFEHPDVRDYYLTLIRELVEDYDFDGVELDWIRMAWCCNPPASQQAIDTMTDWHAQVREATAGKTLGLRIPPRLDEMRTVGIDIPAISKSQSIDHIAPSNFWQTTWDVPYDRLRETLGEKTKIFGVIENAPNWMFCRDSSTDKSYYRMTSTCIEVMRANAAGKLAMGVDGIEFFNFFCSEDNRHLKGVSPTRYDAIHELASLDSLRGKPKQYSLATGYTFWSPRFFELADQLPATLENGGCVGFELSMCAEPDDAGLELAVQVVIDRTDAPPPRIGLSFNGGWPDFDATPTDKLLVKAGPYDAHASQHLALQYRLPVSQIRDGWNQLRIYDSENDKSPFPGPASHATRIVGLDLAIRADY